MVGYPQTQGRLFHIVRALQLNGERGFRSNHHHSVTFVLLLHQGTLLWSLNRALRWPEDHLSFSKPILKMTNFEDDRQGQASGKGSTE